MTCPKCRSEDWKLASVVHTGGLWQSKLSKQAAPPTKEVRPAMRMGLFGTSGFLIGLTFFGNTSISENPILHVFFFGAPLLMSVGFLRVLLTPGITKSRTEKYKSDLVEYEKKKICLRCGTTYF